MTTEEKAKAYDEALERAKRLYNGTLTNGLNSVDLEDIFPQLRESEDERIREEIILAFKFANYGGIYDKHIAYLEKQKEQKSLNISAASEWLRKNVCRYMNSEYNEFHKCVEYDGSIDKEKLINDFEKAMQKEQKPIFRVGDRIIEKDGTCCIPGVPFHIERIEDDCYWDGNNSILICNQDDFQLVDQKPTEWSYDNRIQYASVKSGIEDFASTYSFNNESKLFSQLTEEQQQLWREEIEQAVIAGGESGIELARDNRYKENRTIEWNEDDEQYLLICKNALQKYQQSNQWDANIISDWLEKRLRSSYQPKQEWSEEDEKTFWGLTAYIPDGELKRLGITRLDILKKIKSLRSQSQKLEDWTEEDKKILLSLHHVMNCADAQNAVKQDGLSVVDVCNFLFSIEPHWKPSEEQMNYLNAAVVEAQRRHNESVNGFPRYRVLKGLYEQLQKLI